jgi:hypothetical protein
MSDHDRRFADAEELTAYRPVSAWAIVAFLAGLASPIALMHPLGLLVPAAGIALATWTFYSLGHADPPPTGRRWAVAGLVLSLFFSAAAPVRFVVRRHALQQRACAICEQWLEAIRQNRPWLAFELMRPAAARPALDTPLEDLSKNEGFKMGYQRFLEKSAVKMLLARRDNFSVRYLREPLFETDTLRKAFFFHEEYEATFSDGENPGRTLIRFSLERTVSEKDGGEQWKLADVGQVQGEEPE